MQQIGRLFHHTYCALCRDKKGSVAVFWAIVLPIVIGGLGLGTDVGKWYFAKRNLQNAIDAAAVATGYSITSNSQQSTMWYTAHGELVRNGFGESSNVTLTVNYPPQSGSYAGVANAVELIATQPQPRYFSRFFLSTNPNARVRAVAVRQPSGSACVLALDGSASRALYFQGSSSIHLNNCTGAANSNASDAINISGNSNPSAYSFYTAGGIYGENQATVSAPSATNAAPLSDPFSGLSVPSYSGCANNNYSTNTNATINPGVYCNGLSLGSHSVVTMNPGVYIIDRGTFDIKGGAQVTGTGVTIILTSSTGANYATTTINGGGVVTLSASTSGTYEGMLFYQDRNAPVAVNTDKINGDSNTNFTGAIYFPNQEVQFSGNNSNGGGACTKIVAKTITFIGNSYMSNTCPNSVSTINTQGAVALVE